MATTALARPAALGVAAAGPTADVSAARVPTFQTLRTRTYVLLCFYATILLSLPHWYATTTIERRALPNTQVQAWEAELPCPIRVRHTLTLRLPADVVLGREDGQVVAQEIARGLQAAGDGVWINSSDEKRKDEEEEGGGVGTTAQQPTPLEHAACIDWTVRLSDTGRLHAANSLHYIVTITEPGQSTESFLSTSTTRHFSLNAALSSLGERKPSELAWSLASQLSRVLQLPYRDLFFQAALPTIGQSLADNAGHQEVGESIRRTLARIERTETDKRRLPYTRNVRLVFSLINEDASAKDGAASPVADQAATSATRRSLTGVAGWHAGEAQKAFTRRIGPLVDALQGTHRFVTEMQTIWFAPLPFRTHPLRVERPDAQSPADGQPEAEEAENWVHLIKRDDLQIFVDAGEWGLSSSGGGSEGNVSLSGDVGAELVSMMEQNERTLHFILYVPKPAHRPLRIAGDVEATNASAATAWLVPQWGGVSLFNLGYEEEAAVARSASGNSAARRQRRRHRSASLSPEPQLQGAMLASLSADEMDQAFGAFAKQLHALLGVRLDDEAGSGLPSSEARLAVALDALARRRMLGSARESVRTLGSIVRLVDKIKILGVGRAVQEDVGQSLAMLQRARALNDADERQRIPPPAFRQGAALGHASSLAPLSPLRALLDMTYAAELLSSRAFFNPAMLGQLYFPDEHKYAVYTPLFGPLAMPLLVAGIRLLKERRKQRQEAASAATAAAIALALATTPAKASKGRKSKAKDD